ncbi:MAG: glycine--tRNA ligase subunit beta [Omnitrophica WOR_2 bacterium GWA2_63_20]|nr:MAG: glycine--tRNA ligase subunit beta [Omnitrophica WOR_2 bacterium GWA2_63_20]
MPRKLPLEETLLVEIGTEELPAAYLDGAIAQLRDDGQRLLDEAHLVHGAVESFGTLRRLVMIVRGLSAFQRNPAEQIRGPSKQVAFGPDGKPTQALLGFLRARGGTLGQLKTVATERGEYLHFLKPASTVSSIKVLPELIQHLISGLRFPKTMRWDASGFRFARPVRWLLVLDGSTPVRVTVGRLTSGRVTRVGGPKKPKAVAVGSVSAYHTALKRDGIMLDQQARRQRIDQLVRTAGKKTGGVVAPEMITHGLLDEVAGLTERPVPLVGRFDPKYLALPREVLLASMAKHQRVFAVQSASGKLLPAFVAILDGAPRKPAAIRAVMERILNARLADSLLFFEQDRKTPLKSAALAGVTFHEKLGSMEDKTQRMRKLIDPLASAWRLSDGERTQLERACALAKGDLVTTMVKEFPTLQGVMGKHYALGDGEPREVAMAIGEHYLPLAGRSPETLLGSALSVLDKYDTLASYFHIGIEPTGDQDPFGLRRAAQGIIEVAWLVRRPLPCGALFAPWQAAATRLAHGKAHLAEQVKTYLLERLYTFAWPKPVPTRDIIDAVLASRPDDLVDAMERIISLTRFNGNRALLKAAKVIERTANILKGAKQIPQGEPDPSKFQDALEGKLWNLLSTRRRDIDTLIAKQSYGEATTLYGEVFFEPLHEFFAKVMVNVKDPQIQQNRLALMRSINTLYTDRVADLSKLAILEEGTV